MMQIVLFILLLFSVGQAKDRACAVHIESPDYPRLAWMARIEGEVRIRIHVDADGRVTPVSASSGHELLRVAAVDNIKKWLFSSGHEQDTEIIYEFKLEKPEVHTQPSPRVSFDLPGRVVILSNLSELNS